MTKAVHLHWIDWGQPIAFATGDILVKSYGSTGFQAYSGAARVLQHHGVRHGADQLLHDRFHAPAASSPTTRDGQVSLASPCG